MTLLLKHYNSNHNENKSINTIYIAETAIIQNNKRRYLNIKLLMGQIYLNIIVLIKKKIIA